MKEEKMTPIEYLKSYLGVVDGELFDIYCGDSKLVAFGPFRFEGTYLIDSNECSRRFTLAILLQGKYTIKKKPFVPKYGEIYYFIEKNNGNIIKAINIQWFDDLARIKCGWAFRTYKAAEANKERVLAEMKEVMGDPKDLQIMILENRVNELEYLLSNKQSEFIKLEVLDKETNAKHIVGTNIHDCLLVKNGKVEYYNLQNGEGTGGDYEFVEKSLY